MMEPQFNLIDEPWIKVMMKDGNEREFGIRDLFRHAHEAVALAGETPLQNTAVLRFLTAMNVTILYRYDENGMDSAITNRKQALERFRRIWTSRRFLDDMSRRYLERWYERFYLLGGDKPFYQVPVLYRKETRNKTNNITEIAIKPYGNNIMNKVSMAVMNGEVLEAKNTPSPFANRFGLCRETMTANEAARWLIYYMAFSDLSIRKPLYPKATFASRGASIYPFGRSLFESIMLCSCLVNNNKNVYDYVLPAWEYDGYREANSAPYGDGFPNNLPELYTQQSRKIVLIGKDEFITGAFIAPGDVYGKTNAFIEPMFAFRKDEKDKSGMTYIPYHARKDMDGWKEFKNIFGTENTTRWIRQLFEYEILSEEMNIPFQITDIEYGEKSCCIDYVYNSSLTVNGKFLKDSKENWSAQEEIVHINEFIRILENLGRNLEFAMGRKKDEKKKQREHLSEKLRLNYEYYIGVSFKRYVTASRMTRDELRKEELKYAYDVANTCLNNLNVLTLMGHENKKENKEYTIGMAENIFKNDMYKMAIKLGLAERNDENGR